MWSRDVAAAEQRHRALQSIFAALLLARLLYPFFNSPLGHLFSDPLRHWENGARLLHPDVLGSSDPILYQVWMFLLRRAASDAAPAISLGCGILCAAMPYGWYRTLRELQPRERALAGAVLIGMIPESIGLYGYFMNETLLLSLLGFCFWATLRANRKRTSAAYAAAVILWLCAAFTRTVAVPMAIGCLLWLWATQGQKLRRALAALVLALCFAIPAGLHAYARLGFFSPLGNPYLNEIYSVSGMREIAVNYGSEGAYHFGCPSFYNATFYPFSDWTTDRTGTVSIAIDLKSGRAPWIAERAQAARARTFPRWRDRGETLAFTLFGQSWPNSDRSTWVGWLTVWTRWVWAPLILLVAVALLQRRYSGAAYVLPLCALGTLALLLLQSEGVMEGRYREPVDAILVCSALLMSRRRTDPLPVAARAA